ncbi:MAG: hypothetical protein ACW99U_18080 [Candidatus Thorarchaeota archaeon]|jgi:hypothetical protein
MLARNERKGKLIFKDSQKWGKLLPPTTFVMGVFITCVGLFAISNFPPTLKGVALSSIVIFMGVSLAFVGVLTTSVALDARPLAIYENGLEIPNRPFKWQLKGRSHFIAFNDISDIEQRVVERGEYHVITTKSGEILTIAIGTVSNIEKARHYLAECSRKIQP